LSPRRRVVLAGAGLAAAALLAAGCGTGGVANGHPDLQNGQKLFTATCAACHTLEAAGAHGSIGPSLDATFAYVKQQGFPQSTIENMVLDQIRLGSGEIASYTNGKHFTVKTPMPANLYTGQDAMDVAAYVASVAGQNGGISPSPASLGTNGAKIFTGIGCAGCHTLKAAGSTGTVGPNLDQLASKLTVAVVTHQVTNGGAIMPSFAGTLSTAQIAAVAKYVSSVAGK
jgi:cbb3-type cytochrome c oxidase subunit III